MGDATKIEWTDATWNPVTGCAKVSQGCKHCYAEREWPRMTKLVPAYAGRDFTDVRTHADRLDQPLRWKKPRRIFVNSMSDLFHPDVPDEFIDQVFAVMAMAPRHTFQVLTKRPGRMRDYMLRSPNTKALRELAPSVRGLPMHEGEVISPWPRPNVWLGVSVENQAAADERIPLLLDTPAAVRWISAEPLLGLVTLGKWFDPWTCADCEYHGSENDAGPDGCTACGEEDAFAGRDRCRNCGADDQSARRSCPRCGSHRSYERDYGFKFDNPPPRIDWVVVGGESGPQARPMHPQWARDLRDQCAAAGVPFLFKQWGEWAPGENCGGGPMTKTEKTADWFADKWSFGTITPRQSEECHIDDEPLLYRCGKKRAGRLLDGVTHDGYPK